MPVTSLKLPDDLKHRIAAVAAESGMSAHAFMVDAIERQTALAEQRKHFVAEALVAYEVTQRSGRAYRGDDVHRYMQAKASGRKTRRPTPKIWR